MFLQNAAMTMSCFGIRNVTMLVRMNSRRKPSDAAMRGNGSKASLGENVPAPFF
jgi:hypothetical protein